MHLRRARQARRARPRRRLQRRLAAFDLDAFDFAFDFDASPVTFDAPGSWPAALAEGGPPKPIRTSTATTIVVAIESARHGVRESNRVPGIPDLSGSRAPSLSAADGGGRLAYL